MHPPSRTSGPGLVPRPAGQSAAQFTGAGESFFHGGAGGHQSRSRRHELEVAASRKSAIAASFAGVQATVPPESLIPWSRASTSLLVTPRYEERAPRDKATRIAFSEKVLTNELAAVNEKVQVFLNRKQQVESALTALEACRRCNLSSCSPGCAKREAYV